MPPESPSGNRARPKATAARLFHAPPGGADMIYTLRVIGSSAARKLIRAVGAEEMEPLVLTVDIGGLPQAWVELEEAITYHAKQMVAWSVGREVREFRGGWQKNGVRSRIATRSILAIKGSSAGAHRHAPGLTNQMLFVRDRQVCAYCGGRFMVRDLSRDHVVPVSRGGKDAWTNTVTACRSCNTRKGGRAPEQAGMPLLYVPYVPNRHEHFILRNRRTKDAPCALERRPSGA
jgi:5-methylcytosine-specific restriction endonuclease McrA